MPPTKDEVFTVVKDAIEEALGVEEEEVTEDATLVGDLGAESIDFLDIVYKLEEEFGISMPRTELFPDDILTSTEYVVDGKVTDEGMAQLRERMPFADLSRFESNPLVQEFPNLLTVSDFARYVQNKVGASE